MAAMIIAVKSYNGEVKLFCGLTGRNGCNDLKVVKRLRERGLWQRDI